MAFEPLIGLLYTETHRYEKFLQNRPGIDLEKVYNIITQLFPVIERTMPSFDAKEQRISYLMGKFSILHQTINSLAKSYFSEIFPKFDIDNFDYGDPKRISNRLHEIGESEYANQFSSAAGIYLKKEETLGSKVLDLIQKGKIKEARNLSSQMEPGGEYTSLMIQILDYYVTKKELEEAVSFCVEYASAVREANWRLETEKLQEALIDDASIESFRLAMKLPGKMCKESTRIDIIERILRNESNQQKDIFDAIVAEVARDQEHLFYIFEYCRDNHQSKRAAALCLKLNRYKLTSSQAEAIRGFQEQIELKASEANNRRKERAGADGMSMDELQNLLDKADLSGSGLKTLTIDKEKPKVKQKKPTTQQKRWAMFRQVKQSGTSAGATRKQKRG